LPARPIHSSRFSYFATLSSIQRHSSEWPGFRCPSGPRSTSCWICQRTNAGPLKSNGLPLRCCRRDFTPAAATSRRRDEGWFTPERTPLVLATAWKLSRSPARLRRCEAGTECKLRPSLGHHEARLDQPVGIRAPIIRDRSFLQAWGLVRVAERAEKVRGATLKTSLSGRSGGSSSRSLTSPRPRRRPSLASAPSLRPCRRRRRR
jgi:hypothetical protein